VAIQITDSVFLTDEEIHFSASRSSGPGGQNVNKVSTRVTLCLDIPNSPSLSPSHKARIAAALGSRMDAKGRLRVHSQRHRTQVANRQAAVERLVELLAGALRPQKPRHPTRPSRASRERRIAAKKHRGQVKRLRSERPDPSP
jgi:ribosome-associated protein